jgi:ureidoglycolate lyase
MDFSDGRAGISIFHAEKRDLPLKLDLVERHSEGSQAFVPMSHQPFLVVVAEDQNGTPQNIRAFLTEAGQAINIHRGVWHGVLTPLYDPGLFAVIDRIGEGPNLEEYWLPDEVIIATS